MNSINKVEPLHPGCRTFLKDLQELEETLRKNADSLSVCVFVRETNAESDEDENYRMLNYNFSNLELLGALSIAESIVKAGTIGIAEEGDT